MSFGPWFEMECEFKRETDAAILIVDPTTEEEHWIPLSQVNKIVRNAEDKRFGTIRMSEWIAQQKGLL